MSVVTTTPEDSAIGTERDLAIEVVFSAAIEPKSVTSETFQVHGPTGVVEGKLSVDEAKVTFVPTAPWSLLADYSVDIAEKVSAAQAGELGATYQFGFQTRDGVFRKPERLFSSPAYIATAFGNPTGDVVVGWSDQLTPRSTFAAHFDPKTGKWGAAAPLEADTTNDYSGPSLAMNDAGDVVAISGSYAPISLNRAKGGKWRGAKSAGIEQGGMVSLREDGSAMTVWSAMVQDQYDVFAALLSADDKWGTTTTLATKGGPRALARYGTGYLAVISHDPGGEVT